MRWDEEHLVKDCNTDTVVKFIFEFILSRFGCPNTLMSDKGSHFLNEMVETLTKEF